jgi:hypothetical protein
MMNQIVIENLLEVVKLVVEMMMMIKKRPR